MPSLTFVRKWTHHQSGRTVVAPPVVLVHSQLAASSTESVCRTKGTVRVAGDEGDVARIAILTAVSAFHFPGNAFAESQRYLSGDV